MQIIKYADVLPAVSGREFCRAVGVNDPYGTEFLRMRKIAGRLVEAGLDVRRL